MSGFPGETLRDGRYVLERRLGQGGFGTVYEALDRELGVRVALKILRRAEPAAIARFKREFRALASLAHPHLVVLHEFGFDGPTAGGVGAWLYTMERVEGAHFGASTRDAQPSGAATATDTDVDARPPESVVTATPESEARRDPRRPPRPVELPRGGAAPLCPEARARLREVALALGFLHRSGVLHCDIKPSNVLVHSTRGAIVVDFGLATLLDEESSTSGGGTPGYMAPEQIERGRLGPAADVYALGSMTFEAIAGRLPFEGSRESVIAAKRRLDAPRLRALGVDVSDDLDALVARMLARDPGLRPTADEVADALDPEAALRASSRRIRRSTSIGRRPSMSMLLGRGDEVARLVAFVERAAGALAIATIAGPSGIGKSTLADAVKGELDAFSVLEARCYERERSPLEVIDGIASSLVELAERARTATDTADHAASIVRSLHQLAPLAPSCGALAGDTTPAPADGIHGRDRALRALVAALDAASRIAPLVIFVDDLQWLDADGQALLEEALLDEGAPPLVLVATERPGSTRGAALLDAIRSTRPRRGDRRPRLVDQSTLGPLPEAATIELLGRLLPADDDSSESRSPSDDGSHAALPLGETQVRVRRSASERTPSVTAEFARDVVARASGGNPLLLRELALHVAAGGERADASLADVVARRLRHLGGAAPTLLELAAVAGRPLRERVYLRAAVAIGAPDTTRSASLHALFALTSAGLLGREDSPVVAHRAAAARVGVRHSALGEAAISRLSRAARARLHLALAEALEAEAPDEESEAIARHLISADLAPRAARFVGVALTRALQSFAFERAVTLAELGLELSSSATERASLHERRGSALAALGRNRLAARAFTEAARSAPMDVAIDLERRAAEQLLRGGHLEEGLVTLDRVLGVVGWRRPRTRLGTLASLGVGRARVRRDLGGRGRAARREARADRDEAAREGRRADAAWVMTAGVGFLDPLLAADFSARQFVAARRTRDPLRMLRASISEAISFAGAGEPARADVWRLLALAEREAREVGTPLARALATGARAVVAASLGSFVDAFRGCDATELLYAEHVPDAPWDRVTAQHFMLWSALEIGRFDVLVERTPKLYVEAARRGDAYGAAGLAANYANLAWLLTDPPAATRVLYECAAHWKSERFNLIAYDIALARANERLFHGDSQRALELGSRVHAELDRALFLHFQALRVDAGWLLARTQIAAAAGTRGEAAREHARAARRTLGHIEGARLRIARPLARLGRACLRSALGDRDMAARELEDVSAVLHVESLELFSALARRQAAELSRRGAEVRAVDAELAARGLEDPSGVARIFLPGASA